MSDKDWRSEVTEAIKDLRAKEEATALRDRKAAEFDGLMAIARSLAKQAPMDGHLVLEQLDAIERRVKERK